MPTWISHFTPRSGERTKVASRLWGNTRISRSNIPDSKGMGNRVEQGLGPNRRLLEITIGSDDGLKGSNQIVV
jgi:hypothetical protein